MRKLKLSGGERQFQGLKELREARGEIKREFQTLGESYAARKAKRDKGEDASVWEGDEQQRFAACDGDLTLLDEAIAAEQRDDEIKARFALLSNDGVTDPPDRRAGDDTGLDGAERRIKVPARCKPLGKLRSFGGDLEQAYIAGQWVRGVLFGVESARSWLRDHVPEESRAMGETAIAKGGALVPAEMAAAIIDLVQEYGIALADCEVVPMASDTKDHPRATGGVTFYAVNENAEITASDPGFDAVNLTARKFAALVKYSDELDEDSVISIADFLVRKTAWGWAKKLDECLFLGDGTSTYHGIKGLKNALQDGSEVTAITGNTAFSTLDMADFESMIGKMASWAESGAKWYISKAGWAASMLRLANAAGGNTVENIAGGMQRSFAGYPVRFAIPMNSTLGAQTSTEGLCYLGDLMQGVMVGLRRQLRMAIARERYAEYGQIGFIATVRFDINVHDVGGSSDAGGIIGLETPSS